MLEDFSLGHDRSPFVCAQRKKAIKAFAAWFFSTRALYMFACIPHIPFLLLLVALSALERRSFVNLID